MTRRDLLRFLIMSPITICYLLIEIGWLFVKLAIMPLLILVFINNFLKGETGVGFFKFLFEPAIIDVYLKDEGFFG